MTRPRRAARLLLASTLAAAAAAGAWAAETGATHYYAGIQNNYGFAFPPAQGLSFSNILWSESGVVDAAVLAKTEYRNVDMTRVLNIVSATYGTDKTLLWGTYSAAIRIPFGWTSAEGDRVNNDGSLTFDEDSRWGMGDIEFVPLQLNWEWRNFYFSLYQSIIAPTGSYDEDSIANVGRGYWSFDTVGAVTWYKEDWGTEVSWAWGLMHNADSEYIEYHTSNESHVDLAINQRVFDGLKLGLRYYRLNQLHGDWGEDAVLGNLEGFSRGAGVGFEWAPTLANGTLHVSGTYLRGIEDRDGALDAERGMLSVSWTF